MSQYLHHVVFGLHFVVMFLVCALNVRVGAKVSPRVFDTSWVQSVNKVTEYSASF